MKKTVSLILVTVMLAAALTAAFPAAAGTSCAFSDVRGGDWFKSSVDFVAERGIMGGDGADDTFLPYRASTRAMVAVILHRLMDEPAAEGEPPFEDLTRGWYAEGVAWAFWAGIVKGTSETTFDPDRDVTRQEIAAMLYRYAGYAGADVSARSSLSSFPDGDSVADFAADAMSWAVAEGLIVGRGGGEGPYLCPEDGALRCEQAAILFRFISNTERAGKEADPLYSAADCLSSTAPCAAHGAVLHIEAGAPGAVTEPYLGAAIVRALGLDPSIYDVTFGEGSLEAFRSDYSKTGLGGCAVVPLTFSVNNERTIGEPVRFDSLPVAFLRNDFGAAPRAIACGDDRIADEEATAILEEFGTDHLCPAHGCVHLEAGDLTEESFARAIAELCGLGEVRRVTVDAASFGELKNAFDAAPDGGESGPVAVTFRVENGTIKRECGYDASSDALTVSFAVVKTGGDGCRAVSCPYAAAAAATELFYDKYVCREHGVTHISLGHDGPAARDEIKALVTDVLALGEDYSVSIDGESFETGVVKVGITSADGLKADGPVFTPVYSVGEGAAKFTLCKNERDAYKLIVHDGYSGNTGYGSWNAGQTESGWLLDSRADDAVRHGTINDVSVTESSQVIRKINVTSKGVVSFRTAVTFRSGFDGAALDFRNSDGDSVVKLATADGVWKILTENGSFETLYVPCGEARFVFDIKIDLYGETATAVINGADCGAHSLARRGVRANIASFRFASTREDTVTFDLDLVDASVNYGLWEYFPEHHLNGALPAGWTYENAYISRNTGFAIEAKLFDHYLGVGTGGYAEKSFEKTDGNVIVQFSILPSAEGSDTVFTALGGGEALVAVSTDETSFYVNGVKAYDYAKNVWYQFYLICDTESGGVKLQINGIDRGEYSLSATGVPFDTVRVDNPGAAATYDAFLVYRDVYHSDYVERPVKPAGEEEYTVGINTCCMWQNGFHGGWACITPYDDLRPVLGYYDEGNPEVADWEIKYMVEHGIDFQSFVLFGVQETGPVTVGLGMHLEDGYKHAKYSDMLDYCLIWCSASPSSPRDMGAWRDYFVPYLIENHFKDPRYLVLDNRPVLQFFNFIESSYCPYWTAEKRKEAFDYLDEEVRKLGFDGMIYIAEDIRSDTIVEDGIDGLYSYNLGELCTTFEKWIEYTEERSTRAEFAGDLYYVPTSAIGFNRVGWMEDRTPLMTPDDFRRVNEWIRDEYMADHSPWTPEWAKNLTIVCTWNEYGEGHYLMPCDGLHGFDYLDVLREVFTGEGADESVNVRPTEAQLERINRLYPQDLKLIRANEFATYSNGFGDEVLFRNETYVWVDELDTAACLAGYDDNVTYEGGVFSNDTSSTGYVTFRIESAADLEKCAYLGLRMTAPENRRVQVVLGEETDGQFNGLYTKNYYASGEEEYFSVPLFEGSDGMLIRVRIPAGGKLLGVRVAADARSYFPYRLNVLGSDITYKVMPEISPCGDYLFGFDTIFTDLHLFGMFAEWDDEAGVMRLSFPGDVFEFTVGSAFYTVNGERVYLGYKIHASDGVPMIPLNVITARLGYTMDYTDIRSAAVYGK